MSISFVCHDVAMESRCDCSGVGNEVGVNCGQAKAKEGEEQRDQLLTILDIQYPGPATRLWSVLQETLGSAAIIDGDASFNHYRPTL